MLIQSSRSLFHSSAPCKTIPVIESRAQFAHVFDVQKVSTIILRHCNLFELATLLEDAHRRRLAVYVNIDHIEGIHADVAGHFHVAGLISYSPRTLSLGKQFGLETIQRVFAVDSTGFEAALESVDIQSVDLLDISPALVIPYVVPPYLETPRHLCRSLSSPPA